MERAQPKGLRPRRLPITADILNSLFQVWSASSDHYEATMLWAACTLGFFAFLRSGEFTVLSPSSKLVLTPSNICVDSRTDPSFLIITLRSCKTDPFGAGCTLYVGCTHSTICLVAAVLSYLAARSPSPEPLFIHQDGSPLTCSFLVAAVRAALSNSGRDLSRYNGHSFRIGAVTAAAQAGLPDSLIQTLGRWRSSAFLCYIHTPPSTLLSVSRSLLRQDAE